MKATYEPLDFANSITAEFNKAADKLQTAIRKIGTDQEAFVWISAHLSYMHGLCDSVIKVAESTKRCIQRDGLEELAALTFETKINKLVKEAGEEARKYANGWTPIEEGVPESFPDHNNEVLICHRDGFIEIAYYDAVSRRGTNEWMTPSFTYYAPDVLREYQVVAWMELPKPYKEEEYELNKD
jgi:hypothetical protein